MNTEAIANRCPKCQAPLPPSASQGLCPKCLLAAVAMPTEAGQPANSKSAQPPSLEAVAAAFPQLEILKLIGSGGMGAVYKARQPRLDRCVALKLLPHSLAADPAFAERFSREARLLGRLNHPNIVTVHDFGQSGGFFYLLMEFVDGVNLRQAMSAGRFTPQQAMILVPKICEALQFAHDEGILHRDIKPSNILLDTRGRVKIADFGIAKLLGDRTRDVTLTASGAAIGTPQYMAPEQLEHPQDVDQRADIYSLGVVFYEMLTGELPIGRFAPPSEKAAVDSRVDDVIFHALEKEREKRFRSAGEVKTSVEAITAGRSADVKGSPAALATPSVGPKTSLCYITTPEYLRTFRGRYLHLYQGNGQLRLDEQTLSFISGWQRVTIPLASIRALTLGEYSLTAKPVPLQYLEVTFLEHRDSRTLLFTPTRSALLPVWETNKVVAEWALAVQEAVRAATGRTLELSRVKDVRGRSWGEVLKTFELTAALCSIPFLLIPIFVDHRPPNRWTDYVWGPLVTALTLGSLLVMRWLSERCALRKGNLNGMTALPIAYDKDDPILLRTQGPGDHAHRLLPKESRPVSASMHAFYLLIFLLLCFLMMGPWIGDFTGTHFPYPLPASVGKPLAFLTLLLVIYGAVAKSQRPNGATRPGWLGLPLNVRRGLRVALALIGLALVIQFASFSNEYRSEDGRDSRRWSVGAFQPWLEKWQENPASGIQGGIALDVATGSFACGIVALLLIWLSVRLYQIELASKRPASATRAIISDEAGRGQSGAGGPAVTQVNEQLPPPTGPAGISWLAVGSAVCSIPSWLLVIGSLSKLYDSLGPDGLPPRDFTIGLFELFVLGTGGFVGLAALFLGREALREIRRGGGGVLGTRLAVIGVLGIPTGLLVKFLPSLLAAGSRSFGWQPSAGQGELFVGAVLVGILLLAAWAARAVRRWAKCGAPSGPATIPP